MRQQRINQFFHHLHSDQSESNLESNEISSTLSEIDQNPADYITTNLLHERNLTFADVKIKEVNKENMQELYEQVRNQIPPFQFAGFILDPREIYNFHKNEENLESLLDANQIKVLGSLVLKLYIQYKESELEPQNVVNQSTQVNFRKLEARVFMNHRRSRELKVFTQHQQFESFVPKRKQKAIRKEKEQESKQLQLELECRRLYYKEKVTQKQIMNRLKISYSKLRALIEKPIKPSYNIQRNIPCQIKYKKLHA